MAKIVTLKDKDDVVLYPQTSASTVFMPGGFDLETKFRQLEQIQYEDSEEYMLSHLDGAYKINNASSSITTTDLAGSRIFYTAVASGDVIRVSSKNNSAILQIGFSTYIPAENVEVSNIISYDPDEDLDTLVVAPSSGYFILNAFYNVSKHVLKERDMYEANAVTVENDTYPDKKDVVVGGTTRYAVAGDSVVEKTEYDNRILWTGYITSNRSFSPPDNEIVEVRGYYVYYWAVSSGVSYYVSLFNESSKYCAAAFYETIPADGDTGESIVHINSAEGEIRKSAYYTPAQNGYIAISGYSRAAFEKNNFTVGTPIAINEKVREIEQALDGSGNTLKSYKDRVASLNYAGWGNTYSTLTLMLAGDPHKRTDNMQYFLDFYREHSAYVDDMIHLGDIMANTFREDYGDGVLGTATPFDGLADYTKVLNVIGNHDVFNGLEEAAPEGHETDQAYWATNPTKYARYMKNVSSWGTVIQPSGVSDESSPYYKACYYYKDYEGSSIRLIVLDSMDLSEEQVTWFTSVLASARSDGKQVMCIAHIPMDYSGDESAETLHPFDSNWTGDHELHKGQRDTSYLAAVDAFQEAGGSFICWVFGHYHYDEVGTFTNYPRQLYVINPCLTAVGTHQDVIRLLGYKSYDDFNVISVEPVKKYIRIMKVGCEFSRDLKHRGSIIIDYANNRIVSEY